MDLLLGKRAVIFDLDGVLLQSSPIHAAVFSQLFQELGIGGFAYSEFAGMRTDSVFRSVFERSGFDVSPQTLAELTRRKRSLAFAALVQDPPVAAAAPIVIRRLARRYKLAIASSASRPIVDVFLRASQCRDCFSHVVSGDDVENAKPAPDLLLRALAGLGVSPHEALLIEDSIAGVQAGVRAGIRVIGIKGTCEERALLRCGAELVLDDLRDIEAACE